MEHSFIAQTERIYVKDTLLFQCFRHNLNSLFFVKEIYSKNTKYKSEDGIEILCHVKIKKSKPKITCMSSLTHKSTPIALCLYERGGTSNI